MSGDGNQIWDGPGMGEDAGVTEADIYAQDAAAEGRGDWEPPKQLTCERCGLKTDAGTWIGFVYVGAECLTKEDREHIQ